MRSVSVLLCAFGVTVGMSWSCGSGDGGSGGNQPVTKTCGGPPHICYNYAGSYWTESAVRDIWCNAATKPYPFRGTPCPTDARVGGCIYYPGGTSDHQIIFTYYSPDFNASSARSDCDLMGADWVP